MPGAVNTTSQINQMMLPLQLLSLWPRLAGLESMKLSCACYHARTNSNRARFVRGTLFATSVCARRQRRSNRSSARVSSLAETSTVASRPARCDLDRRIERAVRHLAEHSSAENEGCQDSLMAADGFRLAVTRRPVPP